MSYVRDGNERWAGEWEDDPQITKLVGTDIIQLVEGAVREKYLPICEDFIWYLYILLTILPMINW